MRFAWSFICELLVSSVERAVASAWSDRCAKCCVECFARVTTVRWSRPESYKPHCPRISTFMTFHRFICLHRAPRGRFLRLHNGVQKKGWPPIDIISNGPPEGRGGSEQRPWAHPTKIGTSQHAPKVRAGPDRFWWCLPCAAAPKESP